MKLSPKAELILAVARPVLGIAAIVSAPAALIWALNILFGLDIALTIETYFAAFILVGLLAYHGK